MVSGRNELVRPKAEGVLKNLATGQKVDKPYEPFGEGHSADKIV